MRRVSAAAARSFEKLIEDHLRKHGHLPVSGKQPMHADVIESHTVYRHI
jgi:hypothetical protein